jgi:hypothetical protein
MRCASGRSPRPTSDGGGSGHCGPRTCEPSTCNPGPRGHPPDVIQGFGAGQGARCKFGLFVPTRPTQWADRIENGACRFRDRSPCQNWRTSKKGKHDMPVLDPVEVSVAPKMGKVTPRAGARGLGNPEDPQGAHRPAAGRAGVLKQRMSPRRSPARRACSTWIWRASTSRDARMVIPSENVQFVPGGAGRLQPDQQAPEDRDEEPG